MMLLHSVHCSTVKEHCNVNTIQYTLQYSTIWYCITVLIIYSIHCNTILSDTVLQCQYYICSIHCNTILSDTVLQCWYCSTVVGVGVFLATVLVRRSYVVCNIAIFWYMYMYTSNRHRNVGKSSRCKCQQLGFPHNNQVLTLSVSGSLLLTAFGCPKWAVALRGLKCLYCMITGSLWPDHITCRVQGCLLICVRHLFEKCIDNHYIF